MTIDKLMLRTECTYEDVKVDLTVLYNVERLRLMFDVDVGDNFASEDPRTIHGLMGFDTEVGELLDAYKKHWFYHKPLDTINILEEIGDIAWYVTLLEDELNSTFYGTREVLDILARYLGGTLEKCELVVIEKLKIRYPDKFSNTSAETRNLEAERKILENV